jgi:hypothetical protein
MAGEVHPAIAFFAPIRVPIANGPTYAELADNKLWLVLWPPNGAREQNGTV